MENCRVNNLTAFIPAKDFQISCKFYEDLGFVRTVVNGNAFRYELDGFSFWLQDYYVKEWAENCMLCLYVKDIQSWYARINSLDISQSNGGETKIFSKPHEEHGSLIMNIADPSGVLWHIYQGA